jgi:hypothetical protein
MAIQLNEPNNATNKAVWRKYVADQLVLGNDIIDDYASHRWDTATESYIRDRKYNPAYSSWWGNTSNAKATYASAYQRSWEKQNIFKGYPWCKCIQCGEVTSHCDINPDGKCACGTPFALWKLPPTLSAKITTHVKAKTAIGKKNEEAVTMLQQLKGKDPGNK